MEFIPLGPVDVKSELVIIMFQDNTIYGLSSGKPNSTSGVTYRFLDMMDTSGMNSGGKVKTNSQNIKNLVKFKVTGVTDNFILQESGKNFYLGEKSFQNNVFADRVSQNQHNKVTQTMYQEWSDPTVFLSGALYDMETVSKQKYTYEWNTFNLGIQVYRGKIFFLPLKFFTGCIGTTKTTNTKVDTIILATFCSLTTNAQFKASCSGQKIVDKAWTNIPDCNAGILYKYCEPGKFCAYDCKSPCTLEFKDKFKCEWNNTLEQFTCVAGGIPIPFSNILRIILIIFFIIIIIVIIFYIIRYFYNKSKNTDI